MLLCSDSKAFLPSTLVEWVQLFSGLGIIFAASTYFFNQKIKRAEWLKSLFEKFYENEHLYKDVRKWLDFGLLEKELAADNDHDKEEKLADFLNFFEFIAVLENGKQIQLSEIEKLFSYYLKLIKRTPICQKYIASYEFKNLPKLLDKIK